MFSHALRDRATLSGHVMGAIKDNAWRYTEVTFLKKADGALQFR